MTDLFTSAEDYQWVYFTGFMTQATCWALHEFMERKLGMEPKIITSIELQKAASTKDNPMKAFEMNKRYGSANMYRCYAMCRCFSCIFMYRLTKSLNVSGGYRIQTRGAVYFVKAIYSTILFITCIIVIAWDYQWFLDHFFHLKAESVYFMPYQHIAASLVGFYCWAVIVSRYGKLQWSIILHHWTAAACAVGILMGRYTPFATWYGFTVVAMLFPIELMLGFRAQYSLKYPSRTRKGFVFTYWWTIFCLIFNFSGQIFLVINALAYHYDGLSSVALVFIMGICNRMWLVDDYYLLKSLKIMSTQKYEIGDALHEGDQRTAPRALGGVSYMI